MPPAAVAERGALEEADNAVGLVAPSHPFEVLAEADITPEEAQASEDDDEPVPGHNGDASSLMTSGVDGRAVQCGTG